jgi:hypothetical protein
MSSDERPHLECRLGDEHILTLDGNVVELFHLGRGDEGKTYRWHITNVGIEAGIRGDSVLMRIGGRTSKGELRRNAQLVKFPAAQMEQVAPLIERAKAARGAAG